MNEGTHANAKHMNLAITDLLVGDEVTFEIDGSTVHGKVAKLNKRTIKATYIDADENEHEISLKEGEFGRPKADSMSKTIQKYRSTYVVSVSASQRKSLNNGDELAKALEFKDHEAVMAAAETLLELESGTLFTKYKHLNNGQKRMNAGNRIRAALKRGDIVIEDVIKAL